MVDNPFQTPESDVERPVDTVSKGSLWLAVLIGGVVDIGGTMLYGMVVGTIYVVQNATPEMTAQDVESMMENLTQDISNLQTTFGIVSLMFGMAFSVLGGFICAVLAKARWQKAVLILGGIMAIYGLAVGAQDIPILKLALLTLLSFGSIYLGGWLRGRRLNIGR